MRVIMWRNISQKKELQKTKMLRPESKKRFDNRLLIFQNCLLFRCITEITARNTVLSIVRMLNDTSFIAFMFNEKCIDDINALDSMSADCFVDTNFR